MAVAAALSLAMSMTVPMLVPVSPMRVAPAGRAAVEWQFMRQILLHCLQRCLRRNPRDHSEPGRLELPQRPFANTAHQRHFDPVRFQDLPEQVATSFAAGDVTRSADSRGIAFDSEDTEAPGLSKMLINPIRDNGNRNLHVVPFVELRA